MISIKDKNFWAATTSESYYFPETLVVSRDKYIEESVKLGLLRDKNIIGKQEYVARLQVLDSIKIYENDHYYQDFPLSEGAFKRFREEVIYEINTIYPGRYLKLSRFEQLKN